MDGVIFAVTGPLHRRLAESAARSVRAHMPDVAIDVFADEPFGGDLFDRFHQLPGTMLRPKMMALRESRFERTLCLDSDILMVADCSDLFTLLDRFDMAIAHDQWRNTDPALRTWRHSLPNAFAQLNSGVIAVRRSQALNLILAKWEEGYETHGAGTDQPALREVLWEASEIRVTLLPEEYNLWDIKRIDRMTSRHTAPRIVHSLLYKRPRVLAAPNDKKLALVLGHGRKARLDMLLAQDRTLHPGARPAGRRARLGVMAQKLRDIPRWTLQSLGRPYP